MPSLDEVEERRTETLFERVRETLEGGSYRRRDEAVDRWLEAGHSPTDIASALIHLLSDGGDKPAEGSPKPAPRARVPAHAGPRRNGRRRRRGNSRRRAFPQALRAERPRPAQRAAGTVSPAPVSHERGMTRLVMNVGQKYNIRPGDIVGVIAA